MIRILLSLALIGFSCDTSNISVTDSTLIQHIILEKSFLEDKFILDVALHQPNHEKINMSSRIQEEHLILRIPFVSCEICKTQEIESINDYLSDFNSKVSIVISGSNFRELMLFNRINPTNFKVFEFKSDLPFSFWDQYGKPYALLINQHLQIVGFHLAMTNYPDFSNVFYQNIQSRWSREKSVDWNNDVPE
jgi:hypothetical protein